MIQEVKGYLYYLYVEKNVWIRCAVTVQLICAFVYAYEKSKFLITRLIRYVFVQNK